MSDTRAMAGRDRRTRYSGVYARHRDGCAIEQDGRCDCKPSYYGKVWDREHSRSVKTRRFSKLEAARSARRELERAVERGVHVGATLRLSDAAERFVRSARDGVALNKRGRRYKPSAVKDIDDALRVWVLPSIGAKRLTAVRRSDCQAIVDRMVAAGRSGSRVRHVVNALHSLYRWAEDRERASGDPARLVRLPEIGSKPRKRIVTPAEAAMLVDALPLNDAMPYAIALYAGLRRGEIQRLSWADATESVRVREGKSDAARREAALIAPLAALLRRHRLAQGRPDDDALVCPPSRYVRTGVGFSSGALAKRAALVWETAELQPLGLHDCRHSFITWLDAAGVRPKVASYIAGHSLKGTDGAAITQAVYTHVLPGDLELAGEQLEAYVSEQVERAAVER